MEIDSPAVAREYVHACTQYQQYAAAAPAKMGHSLLRPGLHPTFKTNKLNILEQDLSQQIS